MSVEALSQFCWSLPTVQGLLLIKEGKGICLVVAVTSFSGWLSRHNSRFCKQFLIIIINKFWEGFLGGRPVDSPKRNPQGQIFFFVPPLKINVLEQNRKKIRQFSKINSHLFLHVWVGSVNVSQQTLSFSMTIQGEKKLILENGSKSHFQHHLSIWILSVTHDQQQQHFQLAAQGIYQLFSSNRYTYKSQ